MSDDNNGPPQVDAWTRVPPGAADVMPVGSPLRPIAEVAAHGPALGLRQDDVRAGAGSTPSQLVGGPGQRDVTEWEADRLEAAADNLEQHAGYLRRLAVHMEEIKDLLGGAAALAEPGGALGGFPKALSLATAHHGLHETTSESLKALSTDLYSAADALREVKRKYDNAEGANKMSAQEMQRAFAAGRQSEQGRGD
ncbi:hypothetical protein AB0I95_29335 [Micromonospora sp. NPDC049751]|uniref:hypothetical protein n=1 Tax=unclassified Micromonospora TaxID=2617518 RepID=UPI00340FD0D8